MATHTSYTPDSSSQWWHRLAWKHISDIRSKLFWRVLHLREQNKPKIDVLAQFTRGATPRFTKHLITTHEENWEEKERCSYEQSLRNEQFHF